MLLEQKTSFIPSLWWLNELPRKVTFTFHVSQELKRQTLISSQHGVMRQQTTFPVCYKIVPCCHPPPILPPCCNLILFSHAAAKIVKLQHYTNTAGDVGDGALCHVLSRVHSQRGLQWWSDLSLPLLLLPQLFSLCDQCAHINLNLSQYICQHVIIH